MSRKPIVIYMAVTSDKYELPIAVAESAPELAAIMGVSRSTVCSSISRYERGGTQRSRYVKVVVR